MSIAQAIAEQWAKSTHPVAAHPCKSFLIAASACCISADFICLNPARRLELDLQHRVVLALQVHPRSSGLILTYLLIYATSSRCECRQVVGFEALRPLRSCARMICRRFLATLAVSSFAQQEGEEDAMAYLLPNRRLKKPGFSASMKRGFVFAQEAVDHILVGLGNVGALQVDGGQTLVGRLQPPRIPG